MAYIGNTPAESYASFERQVFTIVNSQTAYTLNHAVTNENEIRLVVNNVVQEPGSGKAFTASGTTLTLSAALVNGTDEMYCVFLGRALQTVNPPNGSVDTPQLVDNAVSATKLSVDAITGQTSQGSPADGDQILVHDASASALRRFTRSDFLTGIDNTPAFLVTKSANQTVNATTNTLITWDSETVDSDNNFASNKFTPTTAGYYLFNVIVGGGQNDDMTVLTLKKNGSTTYYLWDGDVTDAFAVNGSVAAYANGSGDYFEIYLYHGGTGTKTVNNVSHWSGFKLIGV